MVKLSIGITLILTYLIWANALWLVDLALIYSSGHHVPLTNTNLQKTLNFAAIGIADSLFLILCRKFPKVLMKIVFSLVHVIFISFVAYTYIINVSEWITSIEVIASIILAFIFYLWLKVWIGIVSPIPAA
jgi:hypothetical protein